MDSKTINNSQTSKSKVSAAEYLYSNGLTFLDSQGPDVPANYPKARRWLMGAAACGHSDAAAKLALMSLDGHGITNDLTEAMMWFQIAKINNPDFKLGPYKKKLPEISDKTNSIAEFRAHDWFRKNPPIPDVMNDF